MKINESLLQHYQTSPDSPVDREGYLYVYKKGDWKASCHKRWFVLKGNLLFYKDGPADRDVLGVIVLEGCVVQLCESQEHFAFSLVWSDLGPRTYKLAADDQHGQEDWIKVLLSANHRFLSLLLMDFQARYQELLGASSSSSWQSSGGLQHYAPPGAAATTNHMFPAPPTFYNPTSEKSPQLWPKRNANVMPIYGPAPPQGEWLEFRSGKNKGFIELHEEFGKEVKELIADWLKRGRGEEEEPEENLIDFG